MWLLIFFPYLVCKQVTLNFKSWMILSQLLLMNKQPECKGQQIYSDILRKISKEEARSQFH